MIQNKNTLQQIKIDQRRFNFGILTRPPINIKIGRKKLLESFFSRENRKNNVMEKIHKPHGNFRLL